MEQLRVIIFKMLTGQVRSRMEPRHNVTMYTLSMLFLKT